MGIDANNLLAIGLPVTLIMMRLTGEEIFAHHIKQVLISLAAFSAISTFCFWRAHFTPFFLFTWCGYFIITPIACAIGAKLGMKLTSEKGDAEKENYRVMQFVNTVEGIVYLCIGVAVIVFMGSAKSSDILANNDHRIVVISKVLYYVLGLQYIFINPLWKRFISKSR